MDPYGIISTPAEVSKVVVYCSELAVSHRISQESLLNRTLDRPYGGIYQPRFSKVQERPTFGELSGYTLLKWREIQPRQTVLACLLFKHEGKVFAFINFDEVVDSADLFVGFRQDFTLRVQDTNGS